MITTGLIVALVNLNARASEATEVVGVSVSLFEQGIFNAD